MADTNIERRTLLAGTAAVAATVGTTAAAGIATPAQAAATPAHAAAPGAVPVDWKHAVAANRGSEIAVKAGRDKEGRFGIMFKQADAYQPPDDLLRSLAVQMGEPNTPNPADLDNSRIPAGFTFLGQFIDHDMTLDRTPLADAQADPLALTNFDTPLFDLGSLYGRGPAVDPGLYEADRTRMKIVRNADGVDDLPRRDDGTAIIGDARNDENLIVAQLHLAFAKFHNRILATGLATSLAEAQRITRWHFQWIIVHDFLERIAGPEVIGRFLDNKGKVKREFYKPKNPHRPMMPIEYSVAAYRFGHSMVRAGYLMNQRNGQTSAAAIFGQPGGDLRGNRPLPARLEIDWWHFFDVPGKPAAPRNASRRIDGKLSLPLFNLPTTVVDDGTPSLAERNLIRGSRLGLPAGQDVATRMGVTPLTNAQLGLPDPANAGWNGKAPLWFYILKEAELTHAGERLGPVGGRIVTEVILGILDADKSSYLSVNPGFRPAAPIAPATGQFRIGDLIRFALGL
ncbi:peroxidase family protein [Actinoplanes xinjiangensis]|uniref:Heme peroxidase n=1 Tax=Actinoplanes xinjiangensis TaxID=512350 RepID=A0A316ELI9_9ACTN|nr:heme peroxidase family protein [Actinoplanes xinjiangensis]PWK31254.1 heme peroxidase [Actinoplanes xinjiangensis]GIF44067.1 myeloperoxidase [Actinoplanes xinjiangensis]